MTPAPIDQPTRELELFLDEYRDWMFHGGGWAETTVAATSGPPNVSSSSAIEDDGPTVGVTSAEVNSFLLTGSARCRVGAVEGRVAERRSLLRFLTPFLVVRSGSGRA